MLSRLLNQSILCNYNHLMNVYLVKQIVSYLKKPFVLLPGGSILCPLLWQVPDGRNFIFCFIQDVYKTRMNLLNFYVLSMFFKPKINSNYVQIKLSSLLTIKIRKSEYLIKTNLKLGEKKIPKLLSTN